MLHESHGRRQIVFAQRHLPERGGLSFRNEIHPPITNFLCVKKILAWDLLTIRHVGMTFPAGRKTGERSRDSAAHRDDLFTNCLAGRTIFHSADCSDSDVRTIAAPTGTARPGAAIVRPDKQFQPCFASPCAFLRNLSRQSAGGQTSGGMSENHAFAASSSTISR